MKDAIVKIRDPDGGTWTARVLGSDVQLRWASRHSSQSLLVSRNMLAKLLQKLDKAIAEEQLAEYRERTRGK